MNIADRRFDDDWQRIWSMYSSGHEPMGRTALANTMRLIVRATVAGCEPLRCYRFGLRRRGSPNRGA